MKNLAIALAAALLIATIGCGDSKSPMLTYVARSSSDDVPHLFTLNEATQQSTAVSIPIPDTAYYVAANSAANAVTYCRDADSGWDIFLMGTDGVEKQLTTGADACESVFSPDGKAIAFISGQSGDLQTYTMNVDGTNQAALFAPAAGTAEQFYPEFSPDGKSLVIYIESAGCNCSNAAHRKAVRIPSWATQRHGTTRAQVHPATAPPAGVSSSGWYVMALTDTAPTLAYATTSWWGPAVFSGDGSKLLLTMWDGNDDNVFSVNMDGSGLTPLTTSTDTDNFSPVPYKNLIVFNRYNGDTSSWDIYVMNQDGSNQTLVHTTANTWETLLDSYWSGD